MELQPGTNRKGYRRDRDARAPTEEGTRTGGEERARSLRAVCHDVANPAATIRMLAEAAMAEYEVDEDTAARLRQIIDEAGRIDDICSRYLEDPPETLSTRLDLLAADLLAQTRLSYDGAVETMIEPVTVALDHELVTHVLRTLIQNACKAAGNHGRVRVAIGWVNGQAQIEVADSGPALWVGDTGRASLGLEQVEPIIADRGGTVALASSDLGGLGIVISFPPSRDTPT